MTDDRGPMTESRCVDERPMTREDTMMDVMFIAITILFFAIATAYVRGCDRLR
jgi:hypothetical protein